MENWKMENYSVEKLGKDIESGLITVPAYQRGIVWNSKQKERLIDSMKKGYPFGSILLSGNDQKREIVDGLQRSRTIIDFVNNPASFFSEDYIDDSYINKLIDLTGLNNSDSAYATIYERIVETIKKWVVDNHKDNVSIQSLQVHRLYKLLRDLYPSLEMFEDEAEDILANMFVDFQSFCREMSQVQVPALVYFGDPDLLPEIFERINSQGSTLTKQEIYAAAWSKDYVQLGDDWKEILVINRDRYEQMLGEDMELSDYDSKKYMSEKKANLFELVFGFGKILSKKYPYLFKYDDSDPTKVESVGFNLLNACLLQKSADMRSLNKSFKKEITLESENVSLFLERIIDAVEYVDGKLSMATKFKGNSRKKANISPLFSEFQIISMVATVFVSRHVNYSLDDKGQINDIEINCEDFNRKWANMKDKFSDNVLKIALMDVLTSKWKGSGDKKMDNILFDSSYYSRDISWEEFEQLLDVYFNTMNSERNERDKVTSPKETEKILLNIIYSKIFTADEQINNKNFDIEHLATKDLMKKRISSYDEDFKLPISSIGNLCLLPEYDNRSKKNMTIYQDSDYLKSVNLDEIENKYTFTTMSSMEWLNNDSQTHDEFAMNYYMFLKMRFDKMKQIIRKNIFKYK